MADKEFILDIIHMIVSLIGIFFTGWVAIIVSRNHKQFNSKMDDALKAQRQLGDAEGTAREKNKKAI